MNTAQEKKLDEALTILRDVGGKVWNQTLAIPTELADVPGYQGRERMPAKEYQRYMPQYHRDLALRDKALSEQVTALAGVVATLVEQVGALTQRLDGAGD